MIQFADLYKAFDGKPVLAGVTLDVQDGETMVIIGYSGTGKSVALKHVVGLLQPDAGDVIVDGRPVAALDRAGLYGLRRDIGFGPGSTPRARRVRCPAGSGTAHRPTPSGR